MVEWLNGWMDGKVEWWNRRIVEWKNSGMVERWNGRIVEWLKGGMEE